MKNDAINTFKKHGGQLRMSDALKLGINRYMLYSLRDLGIIEQITRGVYRLAESPSLSMPDLSAVCSRYPRAVICLISALSFHNITTQIPHEISVALPRGSRKPKTDWPPIKVHLFSKDFYSLGIEEHIIDGVTIKIYDPEKTLTDCFRFRNQIGLDVAIEALKLYRERMKIDLIKLSHYTRQCKVEKIIQPYLEAIV